jgi:hypothetical protein
MSEFDSEPKFSDHPVSAELSTYAEFYEFLSDSAFRFVPLGVKGVGQGHRSDSRCLPGLVEWLGEELGETRTAIVRAMLANPTVVSGTHHVPPTSCRFHGLPAPEFRWDNGLWVEMPFIGGAGEEAARVPRVPRCT